MLPTTRKGVAEIVHTVEKWGAQIPHPQNTISTQPGRHAYGAPYPYTKPCSRVYIRWSTPRGSLHLRNGCSPASHKRIVSSRDWCNAGHRPSGMRLSSTDIKGVTMMDLQSLRRRASMTATATLMAASGLLLAGLPATTTAQVATTDGIALAADPSQPGCAGGSPGSCPWPPGWLHENGNSHPSDHHAASCDGKYPGLCL